MKGIAVCAAMLLFLTLSGLVLGLQKQEWLDQRAVERSKWKNQMRANGCIRTGYVATAWSAHPVWSCPDGQAYLEVK